MQQSKKIVNIKIYELKPNKFQNRLISLLPQDQAIEDPTIIELANNIKEHGLLQPIVIRHCGGPLPYEIIAGHRRVLAAKRLGWKKILATLEIGVTDSEAFKQMISENDNRSDQNPIELALTYKKAIESKTYKDIKSLSIALKKSESHVNEIINSLCLDKRIVKDVRMNKDSIRDARYLRTIRQIEKCDEKDKSEKQYELYIRCKKEKLSRSQAQQIINQTKSNNDLPKLPTALFTDRTTGTDIVITIKKKVLQEQCEQQFFEDFRIEIKKLIEKYSIKNKNRS